MKPCSIALPLWVVLLLLSAGRMSAQVTNYVRYTLLNGSYLVDDCLICGRPTIEEPLHGTFNLVLLQNTPPYTRYAIRDINFTSSAGTDLDKQVTGDGTYQRLEEFAVSQDMTLAVQIKSLSTNEPAFFTNATPMVDRPFPLIHAVVTQTNGNYLHTITIELFAAPLQEIWFSTSKSLTATNLPAPTNVITAGDLVSSTGRVIKRNSDLLKGFGIMPPVPDLGLDAVDVKSGGEILLSLPTDVFSETIGTIQHGDLLSSRGVIVKRNQQLLGVFQPPSTNDAGLDAVQVMPSGEILFSIQTNVVISSKLTLSRGDILSDQGYVYLSHQQLYAKFQPTLTNYDLGVAAWRILPSGEIWFSSQEGFTDNTLGVIQPGDLLSSLGYKVFSNQELVAALGPVDPSVSYGLDALWVVTDTLPAKPPPVIVKQTLAGSMLHLEWQGPGNAFQILEAPSPLGPWLPGSGITPDTTWDSLLAPTPGESSFFRVRQW